MEEIIKIQNRDGKQAVSARELYIKLGFDKAKWSRWYEKNIIENPYAQEGVDWVGFPIMVNGNETKEFALSIDFAKRLSMLARTEMGEMIRNYFIECEKAAQQSVKSLSPAEALLQSVQMLVEQDRRLNQVEYKVHELKARTKTRPDYFTVAGYAALNKIECGLKLASSLGKKATALCNARGYQMEEMPDPRFGKVKTYPLSVLEEVFNLPIK